MGRPFLFGRSVAVQKNSVTVELQAKTGVAGWRMTRDLKTPRQLVDAMPESFSSARTSAWVKLLYRSPSTVHVEGTDGLRSIAGMTPCTTEAAADKFESSPSWKYALALAASMSRRLIVVLRVKMYAGERVRQESAALIDPL